MSQLQQLLESANNFKNVQKDAQRLASKWERTGLLKGLDENSRNSMALMLENQAKQLVVEGSTTGGATGAGTFTVGTGAQWAGIALPLVRKVFGQISTKEFVSTQPMNMPSGLVFFLDFQYGTTKTPFTAGQSLYGDTGSNFGNTNTGGLYGAGRFGFSTQNTSSATTLTATSSADWFRDLNADGDYSASFGSYSTYQITTASLGSVYDTNALRGFYISGSGILPSNILPAFTKVTGSNLMFIAADNLSVSGSAVTVFFTLQPTDAKRGDFEDGNTNLNAGNTSPITIPEINIDMRSEGIIAKTKKLKAVWTPEFAQDLNAYQSLDAEAEITSVLGEYISLEIDLEMLDMLVNAVPSSQIEYWTAENNKALNSGGFTNTSLGYYNTQGGWFQTFGTKINKISNIIHQKTLRGGANFLVCSPSVATILESIPGFASNSDGDAAKMTYAFGVQKSGQLQNKYTVYKNPYMTENTVLMGFRGNQFLEAGAVFAPYIPLIMTPLIYDPDSLTPRKGLLTRFAKKVVRPEFFGKIYVSGLNTI